MHIYWTRRSVPELSRLPFFERRSVIHAAVREYASEGQRLAYGVPVILAAALAPWLGSMFTDRRPLNLLLGAPLIFLGAVIGDSLLFERVRPYLAEVIAKRKSYPTARPPKEQQ